MKLDPEFDADFSRARQAVECGWIRREAVEAAMLAAERTPGSRLLDHLPLTPEQIRELEAPRAAPPPEVEKAAADPASRVGRFVLVESLSGGAMGRVYKAWDPTLSRWVAMKLPKGEEDRFESEARLAAGLSHPNIAAIYEVGRHEGAPYIAMQFIPGRTLEGFPRTKIEAIAAMIRDAARAVAFAHAHGVIHRDLKPSNLMVTLDGRVYVVDFGLARPMETDRGSPASRGAVGTPSYTSPEQARGEEVDARTDVYSLGATLYRLLAGRAPHEGTTVYEVLRNVEESDPPRPRKFNPKVPGDLETITLKCLDKDPARRYATADALADDLERFLAGEAIEARPAGAIYRLRKKLAKRSVLIPAAAACVAMAAAAAILVPRWRDAARERDVHIERGDAESRARPFVDEARRKTRQIEELHRSPEDVGKEIEAVAREAAGLLGRALAECPGLAEAHLEMGRVHFLRGALEKAREEFTNAIEADGRLATARLERALVDLERYEHLRHEAEGHVRPPSMESEKLLAVIKADLEAVSTWSRDVASLKHAEAMVLFADGKWAEAAERWNLYLAHAPGDALAWEWRGHSLLHAGRPADAVAALDRTILLRPRYAFARLLRARARSDHQDFDGAIEDYTKAITLVPTFALAYHDRGLIRMRFKDYDLAIGDFSAAITHDPNYVAAYNVRGYAKTMLKNYAEAIEDFDRALELDPKYAFAYANRGNAFRNRGDFKAAAADYRKCLDVAPPDWAFRNKIEVALQKAEERLRDPGQGKEYGEARRLFDESSRRHKEGKYAEAVEGFRKVAEQFPDDELGRLALYNKACAHALLGEKSAALDELEKLVDTGFGNLAHVEKDVDLDSLRGEERFRKLLEKLRAQSPSSKPPPK